MYYDWLGNESRGLKNKFIFYIVANKTIPLSK